MTWEPLPVTLQYRDSQGLTYMPLKQGTTTLTLPSLNGAVLRNISLTFESEAHFIIKGRVLVKNELRRHLFTEGGSFVSSSNSAVSAKVSNQVPTYEVMLTFDEPLPAGVLIKNIVFNQQPKLAFSKLRFLLIFLPLLLGAAVLKHRVYELDFDCTKRRHRLLYVCSTLPAFAVVLMVFYYNNPVNGHNAYVACQFPQECTFALGTPDNSLLRERPATAQQIYQSQLYDQQFDAFLKGRLSFDLEVNPRLLTVDNPYEISNLYEKQVGYLFDRTYYQGRYYSYYGLTPILMSYLPVYALTGKFPVPSLTNLILTLFAAAAMFWALYAAIAALQLKPNLLLTVLGANAAVLASQLLYLQGGLEHYFQAVIAAVGWCCVTAAAAAALYRAPGGWRSVLWAGLIGFATVMTVCSRPNLLLLDICFMLPLLLRWKGLLQARRKVWLAELGVLGGIMAIGCAAVMWYNYARFGSVLQFGQNIVLSAYDAAKTPLYSLYVLVDGLQHLFVTDFTYLDEFPFISIDGLTFDDAGNIRFGQNLVGIRPFCLSFGLLLFFYRIKDLSRGERRLRGYLALIVLAAAFTMMFSLLLTNVFTQRYGSELCFVFMLVSLLLVIRHISWGSGYYQKLVYLGCVGGLVQTCIVGALCGAIGAQQFRLNVEGLSELINIFRPFA